VVFGLSKYEENLKIAKTVFKEIKALMNKFENDPENEIFCCWDECLWVNDDFFSSELRKDD
jgi:hypothetical protein